MRYYRNLRYNLFILLLFGSFLLASCQEKHLSISPTPSVSPIVPSETGTPIKMPDPDLVIELERMTGKSVELEVGQVLQVKRPGLAENWQVAFNPEILEPLTPFEMARTPGEEGWFFRAIAEGEGRLTFTSIVSCDSPVPCPMMPARLELTVVVQ